MTALLLLRIRQVWFSRCVASFLFLTRTNNLWVLLWKRGSLILGCHSSLHSTAQLEQRLECLSPLITMAMSELSQQQCCFFAPAAPGPLQTRSSLPLVWTYPSEPSPWGVRAHMPLYYETGKLLLLTMFWSVSLLGIVVIIWLLWERPHPQKFKNELYIILNC